MAVSPIIKPPGSEPSAGPSLRMPKPPEPTQPVGLLPSVEILRRGMLNEADDPRQVDEMIAQLNRLAASGMARLVQIGNTVFLVSHFDQRGQPLPPATAQVHVYTVENLAALAQRFTAVVNTFRQLGYKQLNTFVLDPGMLRVLQSVQRSTGVQAQVKQDMRMIGDEMTPVYDIQVRL